MTYSCLFLISNCTRNQIKCCFSHITSQNVIDHGPSLLRSPIHYIPPPMRQDPAACMNKDKIHTLYNDSKLRTTSYIKAIDSARGKDRHKLLHNSSTPEISKSSPTISCGRRLSLDFSVGIICPKNWRFASTQVYTLLKMAHRPLATRGLIAHRRSAQRCPRCPCREGRGYRRGSRR